MDSDQNDRIVRSILGNLNRNIVPKVKRNAKKAEDFKELVRKALPKDMFDTRYQIHFIHCGSAYEGLAVNEETDFDIVVMLGDPFESDHFTARRDRESGFFTLEWKTNLPRKLLCGSDNFLRAAALREKLFTGISQAIRSLNVPNATIICERKLVAFTVEVKYATGEYISIDFVPEIAFRTWGQCPDLKPLSEMPKCLRSYVDTLNKNKSPVMFFSFAVPGSRNYSNSDKLFSASFSLLEKNFLSHESNEKLRGMVRLVKLLALQLNWKELHKFQSFFAKRIAVKHCDELKTKDLWEGCKTILSYLAQEVEKGFLDGYFIAGQVSHTWKIEKAVRFHQALFDSMNMDLKEIQMKM